MNNKKQKQQRDSKVVSINHSAEHILMQAMRNLYGENKIIMAMGPAIENGFYYDFEITDPDLKISESDFAKIEEEMAKIVADKLNFKKEEISVGEARKLFEDNRYKQEWLDGIEERGEKATVYHTGDQFVDLCAGPHVKNTKEIGAFKLLSVAGAYWHGDEKNKMLTRIYGTAFATQKELDTHLTNLEEAKKRDHRKIGKALDLFSFHPAAPADAFWHPKGWTIFKELVRYWRDIHEREGYVEVRTPELLTRETWDKSGHTKFFLEKMYRITTTKAEEWDMAIRPMNCDGGILIYKSRPRSYKEFPLYMGELGIVHRYEGSGETLGLFRVREFTQDDAHLYCTPNQVKDELKRVMELCFEVYKTFGLELDHLELSTKPENSIGSAEVWEHAESIMKEVLEEKNVPHQINEGDGAFYGPKFDFHLKDSLGRTWQCSTIQLDFAQPENFDLEYVTPEGTKERPVMIHRVLYGSIERFLGVVIEDCAGNFPVWIAPVQAVVIPISEDQVDYANEVAKQLKEGIKNATGCFRVEVDSDNETMQKKIRNAQLQKVPYMLVVGGREEKTNKVAVRLRNGEDLGVIGVGEFAQRVQKVIETKSLEL